MPTLAELCGIALPQNHLAVDGESLAPLFDETAPTSDRIVITDSQRAQVPKKWKKTSVMQGMWRLVNGNELYHLDNDPSQKNNIAKKHLEKLKELSTFYDSWWDKISVNFDREIYFKLGHPKENPVTLTAHDIHGDGPFAWNQIYIRNGTLSAGYWSVNVVEAGTYEVSLRRYPRESNLGINETTPFITPNQLAGLEKEIPNGKNMEYVSATLRFENKDVITKPVLKSDKEVTFTTTLMPGKTKLYATFTNAQNKDNTAYYVYVEKK